MFLGGGGNASYQESVVSLRNFILHLLNLLPFQQLWPIEGSRAQAGRHWATWNQQSPVTLDLCSSSSHLVFVWTSHFTGAQFMLSTLHLPSDQIMPVTFSAPLNMLPHSLLSCCPGRFCTSLGKGQSPLCAASENRWGSIQVYLFFHSAIFKHIVWYGNLLFFCSSTGSITSRSLPSFWPLLTSSLRSSYTTLQPWQLELWHPSW